MIVVDTSVWIDVLNERDTASAERCVALLQDGAPLALTEVIYSELLRGVRDNTESARLDRYLRAFPVLRLEHLDDFALAARLHRQARAAEITIHKTVDCLIAAPCVREGAPILHDDQDFDRLASCTDLKIFQI